MEDVIIDEVVVTDSPCEIKIQFLERTQYENTVYVVRFVVGNDQPKETISRDREYIESIYNNVKDVIL